MNSPYLTDRERREHDRDNGRTAALADSHELAARILREPCDGLTAVPCEQFLFAMTGTAEERLAAVDTWAAARRAAKYTDLDGRHCARLRLGPVVMIAVAVPVEETAGPDSPDAREDVPELAVA